MNGATVVANRRTSSGEQLPFTGLPVWMAALGGLMLIGGGLWLQRNALEIGTAAGGYRRGPALRPVATARLLLAQMR